MSEVKILKSFRNVAMVGASADPQKPSNVVFRYLTVHGYNVVPVNPTIDEVYGQKCYPSLSAIPGKIDVVDVFRKSDDVPAIVDEAIKIGAKAVWMQEGVVNKDAAKKAESAGLLVVMDKCMRKEHMRLSEEDSEFLG